jgi:hypothetical protein
VLYRIIGNDLVPRHRSGQARDNLKFILDHEAPFAGCEKRFVVNRIVDRERESEIVSLLESAGVGYLRIPFDAENYRCIPWDVVGVPPEYAPFTPQFSKLSEQEQGRVLMRLYRHKNNYVMNNNGARNAALEEGRIRAKWVLPWDGNCFLTEGAWEELRSEILQSPHIPYFVVPMARITDNSQALDPAFRPEAVEEPQLIFRRDTPTRFDEGYFYGRRPKVELLWRLGVPGDWDRWQMEPWDLAEPTYADDAACFAQAGWVLRLDSGRAALETDPVRGKVDRGIARIEAVVSMLDQIDEKHTPRRGNPKQHGAHQTLLLADGQCETIYRKLAEAADAALTRGPYSVVDKTSVAPSRDPQDYWHPAPYYWPNKWTPSGRPYVSRDGQRVPGTRLYEDLSDQYDRTRLQRLFDDTWILALAWSIFGDTRYVTHAAKLVRHWFLQPDTAMHPRLTYAQVRLGHNRNQGSSSGIIEMKDLYFFLDAVSLLERAGALSTDEMEKLRSWLERYLHWLRTSPQGRTERSASNNHGTYYDLQVASIAAFVGDDRLVRYTLRDSLFRIVMQFAPDGSQPEELKRTTTAHYCSFNLQGWIHLTQLAAKNGEDLWRFQGPQGQGLAVAAAWLLAHVDKPWPYRQLDAFDPDRFYPIYFAIPRPAKTPTFGGLSGMPEPHHVKSVFHPHDGIPPFWQLRPGLAI